MLRAALRESLPGTLPLLGALVALVLSLAGALAAVGYGFSSASGPPLTQGSAAMGLFVLPVVSLVLFISAVLERKGLARGLLLAACAFTLTVAGALLAMGMAPDVSWGTAVFGGSLCGFVPAGLVAAGALVSLLRGFSQTRRSVRDLGLGRMLDMLNSRGVLTLAEVSRETNLPPELVDELFEAGIRDGSLRAELDLRHNVVYDLTWLHEQRDRVPSLVATRGEVPLNALAEELRVSRERLDGWIDRAVKSDQLHGFVDWKAGILYSREVEALRASGGCPGCGSPLGLAGKGVVRCPACDARIFL